MTQSKFFPLLAALAMLPALVGHGQNEKEEIKVLRVGSSSFPYGLIEITRDIVEASGKARLVCDKEDATGYTRLDQFISQPGLYEEWCSEQMPKIQAGGYDFVIIQTIGWLGMKPEQQDKLCTEILPDLVGKIRKTGARVILYDKYLPVQTGQKEPRARTWCLRYPEGYKLNYLLHIMAAKHSGIEGVGFGGEAITELWQTDHFDRLSFLYCDPSHPGPIANYISALNLTYLLTGEEPIGSPVRELVLGDGRALSFSRLPESPKPGSDRLYEENKGRIKDGILTLTDEEARALQEAAAKSQREWGGLLKVALEEEGKFAEVMREIRRLQGEMGKYEEYGLDAGTVANLKAQFAPPAAPGELAPNLIAKIRRKSRSIEYAGADVRSYFRKYLSREQQSEVREAYTNYWEVNNSKLRDDLYYGCRVLTEKALKNGDRDEAARLSQTGGVLHLALSFPAYMLLLENVSEEQKKAILENYRITGGTKRATPSLSGYLNENHLDEGKLVHAWKVYMKIWDDPDLMDKLRDNGYPIEVIEEVDREFARRIGE